MTTFIQRTRSSSAQSGFTLVEILISAGLASFLLAGVLSSFLMLGRSGYNLGSYVDLEIEARGTLERFGQDARMARTITWSSSTDLTFTIPHAVGGGSDTVRYYYDQDSSSPSHLGFVRVFTPSTGTASTSVLMNNITDFEFKRYKLVIDPTEPPQLALNNLETKQLQLTLTSVRERATVVTVSEQVISARFILRNKASINT